MDQKNQVAAALAAITDLSAEEILAMLETPPNPEMGDLALPCFKLARTMRMAPPMIAQKLAEELTLPACISGCECQGGYLNFYFDKQSFVSGVLEKLGDEPAKSEEGSGKTIVIDYSSINIAKPFHIGHLSTTAIGNSLSRIFRHLGYNVVGVNHLGDWGTQFGKLIVAYKKWGNKEEVEEGSINALLALYVRFHNEAEENDALNDEARAWFKKIEDGDEEALSLFTWFKELTLKEVGKVYDRLGVSFDSYAGESFYNDKMQPVIDDLKNQGLLEESEGAYVVRLDEENLPPAIILKKDGTTLYATRDLAAAFYRKNTYDFHKCLYVVAYQQNLHFQQLFTVLNKMGAEWYKDMVHVNFGMVSLADGTLSTRSGRVVFLQDVLNQACEKTLATINEKNPDLANKEQVAEDIGVGAVVMSALSAGRIKDIVFDWDRVLNFDGETGPYLQYTHARACSLMRKAEGFTADADLSVLTAPEATEVLRALAGFDDAVHRAADKYEPYIITRQILDIAQAFNKFYFDVRVLDENDPAGSAARLALTDAVRRTLKTGLYLLGIKAPEQM